MKTLLWAICLLLPWSAMAAELDVKGGWVRLVPPVSDSTAAYLTLANPGNKAVRIVGVSADVAGSAMLHGMSMEGGRMKMFGMKSLDVPAHGKVSLTPGGSHVMLMDLAHPLADGDAVNLTFRFADGSKQTIRLNVVDTRGGGSMGGMESHKGGMMQHDH